MLGRPLDDLLGFRSSQSSSSSNGVSTQGVSENLSSLRRLMRVPAVNVATIAVVTNSQSIVSVVIVDVVVVDLLAGSRIIPNAPMMILSTAIHAGSFKDH